MKEVVSGVRAIRLQKNIAQKEALELEIVGESDIINLKSLICKLCNLSAITTVEAKAEGAASFMVGTTEFAVPLGNLIDAGAEAQGRFLAGSIEEAEQ